MAPIAVLGGTFPSTPGLVLDIFLFKLSLPILSADMGLFIGVGTVVFVVVVVVVAGCVFARTVDAGLLARLLVPAGAGFAVGTVFETGAEGREPAKVLDVVVGFLVAASAGFFEAGFTSPLVIVFFSASSTGDFAAEDGLLGVSEVFVIGLGGDLTISLFSTLGDFVAVGVVGLLVGVVGLLVDLNVVEVLFTGKCFGTALGASVVVDLSGGAEVGFAAVVCLIGGAVNLAEAGFAEATNFLVAAGAAAFDAVAVKGFAADTAVFVVALAGFVVGVNVFAEVGLAARALVGAAFVGAFVAVSPAFLEMADDGFFEAIVDSFFDFVKVAPTATAP